MVWPSSAQGNRPFAPATTQAVCKLVTPSSENAFFFPFPFNLLHTLLQDSIRQLLCNHILPHSLQKTWGVGILRRIRLMFSGVYKLFQKLEIRSSSGCAFPSQCLRPTRSVRETDKPYIDRCDSVVAPLESRCFPTE